MSTAPGERIAHLVPPGMAAAPKKRSKARSKPLAVIEPAAARRRKRGSNHPKLPRIEPFAPEIEVVAPAAVCLAATLCYWL